MTDFGVVSTQQYSANVIRLLQERGRLRSLVTEQPFTGRTFFVNRVAPTETIDMISRFEDSPNIDQDVSNRMGTALVKKWGTGIDKEDLARQLWDPTSSFTQNCSLAFQRAIDRVIIKNMLGPARYGIEGENMATLPSSQIIDVTSFDSSALLQVAEVFDNNNCEEERVIAIGPRQKQDMLKDEKLTNSDFSEIKALVPGKISYAVGSWFVMTTLLDYDATSQTRKCFAFTKNAFVLGVNKEYIFRYTPERVDKSYNGYLYAEMSFGGVRVDEQRVVQINANEA